jgi:hypothetical protein
LGLRRRAERYAPNHLGLGQCAGPDQKTVRLRHPEHRQLDQCQRELEARVPVRVTKQGLRPDAVTDGRKPASLYACLSGPEQPPEAIFVGAVVRNLRRGRALIMIAGLKS